MKIEDTESRTNADGTEQYGGSSWTSCNGDEHGCGEHATTCIGNDGVDFVELASTTTPLSSSLVGCGGDVISTSTRQKRHRDKYTWEYLLKIENRRRAILKRGELPFWKILSYWDGTCLRAMSRDVLIWITIGIYIGMRIHIRYLQDFPRIVKELGNTDIGIVGGFLSFFLVLFVNQSNTRFQEMYKSSMNCSSKIYDVSMLVATTLPHHHAYRMIRYMNAAHIAGYVGLNEVYTKRHFFDKLNTDYQLLLSPKEMARIDELGMDYTGPDTAHELIEWCIMDVQSAFTTAPQNYIDAREAGTLKEKLLQFREAIDNLYDMSDQPVHFFYIHFLCLLSVLYLPLFAIDSAFSAGAGQDDTHWALDVTMGMIVTLQAIFVVGLRLLGQKMVDPYGDDLEDLSVIYYVTDAWKSSNRILKTHYFPYNDDGDDLNLAQEEHLNRSEKESSISSTWESPLPPVSSSVSSAPSPVAALQQRNNLC